MNTDFIYHKDTEQTWTTTTHKSPIPMTHKKLTPLAIFYGIFAAAGAVVPWYFNIVWMRETGLLLTPATFVSGGFINPLTSSITTDFFIGTTPVLIWMVIEARRMGMRHAWLYVVGTFAIAFAFTCPLFLMMRELKLNPSPQLAAPKRSEGGRYEPHRQMAAQKN
jgi:hypothetical protein